MKKINKILPSLLGGCALCALTLVSSTALAQAAHISAALAHPDRPSADVADDERRKPGEVLAFAGLQSGMTVLELEAGGGYYTEILSRAVGENGSVILQHAPGLMGFAGDAIDVRTANNRLSNVRVSITNFDALDVPDNSVDMATWILGPHELGFEPDGASLGDPKGSFQEIARVLKPGGVLVAADHIAPASTGIEAGGTLHRINEATVTGLAQEAGLSLIRSSDMLKNPEDPLDISVYHPDIQGQTSKFLLLFQK